MSTPKNNPDGYLNSAVRNVTGFHNYALAHGTGDDNGKLFHLNSKVTHRSPQCISLILLTC